MPLYPHLLPFEIILWERFLREWGDYFERFEYDLHVGKGVEIKEPMLEALKQAAITLTQKRIDAIGYFKEEVWIFEVKPNAGLSALGQLLGYKVLYQRDVGKPKILKLAVVTDSLNDDERFFFGQYDIKYYEIYNILTPTEKEKYDRLGPLGLRL